MKSRCLRWEPSNEQEVVVLFGRLLDHMPRAVAIEFVQTGFPDCKAIDVETREPIWIEFELYSSHYRRDHSRRPERCNWVVCWHENEPRINEPLVVALDVIVDRQPDPTDYILQRRPPGASNEEYFRTRLQGLAKHHQDVVRELLDLASERGLRVDWPETNAACFTVRDTIEYFKVDSNGRIGTPFSRWSDVPPSVRSELVARLNDTFGEEWFSPEGKMSVDLEQLLPDERAASRYVDIWRKFIIDRQANKALEPKARN
jgi:hypothetical protein